MAANPEMVVVTEDLCNACGTPHVKVHHQGFPELSITGESAEQAAAILVTKLESNLDAVWDPNHKAPVRQAIADVQAFLSSDTAPQPKLSGVIDTVSAGDPSAAVGPSMLAKTKSLEVRRLTLPKGREIPTHHARGEITVHCLAGKIAFTSDGTMREMGPGQLIVLAAGEPHSLVGLEDSTVLVTKVLAPPVPAASA